jgi:hypothetical protein
MAAADEDAIAALRAEIEAYAKGRGVEPLLLLQPLDREQGRLDPQAAAAIAARAELATGCYQLRTALSMLEYAVKMGEISVTIPVWQKGQTLVVKIGPIELNG